MSKRRKIGDLVLVKAYAGFLLGGPTLCVIPDVPEHAEEKYCPCFLCEEEHCREWQTLNIVGTNRCLYHVSECEMEDPPEEINVDKRATGGSKEGGD